MQFLQLKESLRDFTIFSLRDARKIDLRFHRRRLNEWQDKGYIRKVIRGYYVFSDLKLDENVFFDIANKIYKPSYISLEMALSYYHLIPESVYKVTSVSTRRTYAFKTSLAEFNYRTVKPQLFFGYTILRYNGKSFKIACVEKAILDYFYFNNNLRSISDFRSLRINKDMFFEQVDKDRLYEMLERVKQHRLERRIKSFWEFMNA